MAISRLAKALKIIGWTLVAVIVATGVLFICAVKFVDSRYLAPMVEDLVNENIEGRVKLGGLRLAFAPHFPILGIELDSLTVISHATSRSECVRSAKGSGRHPRRRTGATS